MPARKIVQIAGADHVIHALADDGTVWVSDGQEWKILPPLPGAPRCGSNIDRDGDFYWCELAEGHEGRHVGGGRVW